MDIEGCKLTVTAFSRAAMLGCRYPMVPTSALHQRE